MLILQENLVKLVELQRDLVGIDNLIQPGREFLREGCLQKLSRKGYQQRMFFLVSSIKYNPRGVYGCSFVFPLSFVFLLLIKV